MERNRVTFMARGPKIIIRGNNKSIHSANLSFFSIIFKNFLINIIR